MSIWSRSKSLRRMKNRSSRNQFNRENRIQFNIISSLLLASSLTNNQFRSLFRIRISLQLKFSLLVEESNHQFTRIRIRIKLSNSSCLDNHLKWGTIYLLRFQDSLLNKQSSHLQSKVQRRQCWLISYVEISRSSSSKEYSRYSNRLSLDLSKRKRNIQK